MTLFFEIILFICVFLFLHTYIFYPFLIYILSKISPVKLEKNEGYEPSVSVLIAAHNEELVIEETLKTLLNSNYPVDKIQILVGSDNSVDNTNKIVTRLSEKHPQIRLFELSQRSGKPGALNSIVKHASNEIICFCDSNTIYDKNAIKNMVKHYADSKVGGVCGRLILTESDFSGYSGNEEKSYWNIENQIKISEGKLGCLIGANGGIYSIRRGLYIDYPVGKPIIDDLLLPLKIMEKGYYFLYEPEAFATETIAPSAKEELKRKVRISISNFGTLSLLKPYLNPFSGLKSFAFWSHKLLRWVSGYFMILIFIALLFLMRQNDFYLYTALMYFAFFVAGLAGFLLSKLNLKLFPFNLIWYFIAMTFSLFSGSIKFMTTKTSGTWEPTKRA